MLEVCVVGIRRRAGECRALERYLLEEVAALRLVTVGQLVASALEELREYDRPLLREVLEGAEPAAPPGALLPVNERWALVWEEVEEDEETGQRVRADPEDWEPLSVDRLLGGRTWGELWQKMTAEAG